MRSMRFVCWLALPVGLLVGSLNSASAQQPSDAAIQACTPDAMRLCSEFIPDREKVKVCMLRKRRELSVACRTAMRGGARERHVTHRHYRHVRRAVRHSEHRG